MKLEKFSFNEKKAGKWFLYGFVLCAILMVVINLFTSKAKYRTTQSIPLVRGKISYKPADLNVVAMYQQNDSGEYESIDAVPSSGYALNASESYCEVNKVKDTNITMEYENGLVNFNGISKKGTKCYLYFDVDNSKTMSEILAGYTQSTRTDFSTVLTSASTGTVYSADDDLGTSLYFAGAPTDNWVSFGGFYWRIIRMNGDGSTRMIYAGSSPTITGIDDQLANTSAFNSSSNDNAYVGYMYGATGASSYANTHANTNNSTIKEALDTWYSSNLNKTGVKEYIDGNAGFCNDRSVYSGNGYGTNSTYYIGFNKLYTNKTPNLKCTNISINLFTMSSSSQGNGKLVYPIGLITADEVAYAGGVYDIINTSYYLYTGQTYWTLSPCIFDGIYANVYLVTTKGTIFASYNVYEAYGVRPVINLKSSVQFTGDGTVSSPFTLSVE